MRHRRDHPVAGDRLIAALLGVALALFGILRFNARLTPFLFASARSALRNDITAAVVRAVEDGERDTAALLQTAADTATGAERVAAVPIGSLIGLPLLYGRGPSLRMRVLTTAALQIERLPDSCRITADLELFLPWAHEKSVINTEIHVP